MFFSIPKTKFLIFIIAALIFFAYSFMLQGSFKTMDDEISIVQNDLIKDWRRTKEIFSASFFSQNAYYRPLISMSFMAEYHLFGLNAFFYYLTNILIHTATALLLYVLARRLLNDKILAFSVSLFFGIHPVHWEAVSNIPGRAILLCAFFYLAAFTSFCFYISGRKSRYYVMALVLFVLSLLCKESAGMLPAVLLFFYFIVYQRQRTKREIFAAVLPFFALAAAYVFLRGQLGITQLYYWRDPNEALLGFVTFLRSLLTHMRLLVLPWDMHFDRARRLFTGLAEPEALATILVFIFLAVAFLKSRKRLKPVTAFLVFWFFIEFAPVSQFWVTIGVQPGFISAAEHFLYVPSIPAVMLMVLAVKALYEKNAARGVLSPTVFKAGIAGLLFFYLLVTIQNNIYASNEVAMFERTLEINPANVRVRTSLARSYARLNRFDLAEHHYRKAVEAAPYEARARIGLGKALCDLGRPWDGLAVYEGVSDPQGWQDLLDRNKEAVLVYLRREYERILKVQPDNAGAHYSLGVVYSKQGDIEAALKYFKKTLELDADHQYALFNTASILQAHGEPERAVQILERLLAVNDLEMYLREETLKQLRELADN